MTDPQAGELQEPQQLRLLPGMILVALQWLLIFVVPLAAPEAAPFATMGGLAAGLAFLVWWAFFSRAGRLERWGGTLLMIVALVATRSVLHESVATAGMGMVFFIYAVPSLCLALLVWAAATRDLADRPRRLAMVATIVLACGAWTLVRTEGVTGGGSWDFKWRWASTYEDEVLAELGQEPLAERRAAALLESAAGWPGFRGSSRDSIVHGARIETDWSTSPPTELWRRPIGPGWSSFAVRGDLIYTQEQRGDDEVVAAYSAATGEMVWRHRDRARFWEAQAGAGPRATPSLHEGRVYTFGATGILNALDAADGSILWSRNATSDTEKEVPGWGFSSSPLVVGDLVVVHAGRLAAYDLATGELRWLGPARGGSYSSPQLVTLDGVDQILMLSGAGAAAFAPADGALLWEHPWPGGIVQPALTADGDVLINSAGLTGGAGLRRLAVAQGPSGWRIEELWTSNRLKPNFNDFVVHDGHAYGFDGSILACIDVEDGERKWKGGRYGNGQLVLLADQDLLLVLSEKGELALVAAAPDRFTELARFGAIEGKTWNHPVLVGDLLLVRNGQEMAGFRLATAGG